MRHLNTDEILLLCDGELSAERAFHLEECSACRRAADEVEALLDRTSRHLRQAIPTEAVEIRIASRVRLQQALYPAGKVAGYPLKWPAVYATAAMLTMAVIHGYFTTTTPREEVTLRVAQRVESLGPRVEPAALTFVGPAVEPAMNEAGTLPLPRSESPAVEPARFAFNLSAGSSPVGLSALAAVSPELNLGAGALVLPLNLATVDLSKVRKPVERAIERLALVQPPVPKPQAPAPLVVTAALVEGHWMLTRASVWNEDIRPVWSNSGLQFEGSVENDALLKKVQHELNKVAEGRPIRVRLATRQSWEPSPVPVVRSVDRRPPGGAVRQSLVAHFTDAARRSFLLPQPSLVDAEMDRFVSEVFRGQSGLLEHAYALKALLAAVPPDHAADLDQQTKRRLAELAAFHLDAVGRAEGLIYGRLSEGLPRKFWSYRSRAAEALPSGDWRQDSAELLRDTLRLETALTALLSHPASIINAAEENASCGELLQRIRQRAHFLRADAGLPR